MNPIEGIRKYPEVRIQKVNALLHNLDSKVWAEFEAAAGTVPLQGCNFGPQEAVKAKHCKKLQEK